MVFLLKKGCGPRVKVSSGLGNSEQTQTFTRLLMQPFCQMVGYFRYFWDGITFPLRVKFSCFSLFCVFVSLQCNQAEQIIMEIPVILSSSWGGNQSTQISSWRRKASVREKLPEKQLSFKGLPATTQSFSFTLCKKTNSSTNQPSCEGSLSTELLHMSITFLSPSNSSQRLAGSWGSIDVYWASMWMWNKMPHATRRWGHQIIHTSLFSRNW